MTTLILGPKLQEAHSSYCAGLCLRIFR